MRAVIFAYSEIGVTAIETLLDLGVQVAGIVTHEDNPAEIRWFRSVGELARKHGIPAITPESPDSPEMPAWVKGKKPEIIFSFYYRSMIPMEILKLAPRGAYNLHGSLLPKFRGRACVNWAVIEGAAETGVTLHEMTDKPDAGDILGQEAVAIGENDTARDVFDKLVPAARKLLQRVVPLIIEGRETKTPQDEKEATYFGKRAPEDGLIDWNWPARRIHNLIRGVARPYPGAFTFLGGRKLFVHKGYVLDPQEVAGRLAHANEKPAGQLLDPWAKGVPVVTGDGFYLMQEVQFEGGTALAARDALATQRSVFDSIVSITR
jgi:methionyl-tRNA formyltransferase